MLQNHASEQDIAAQLAASLDATREAKLVYVSDDAPGIRRRRAGKGFGYRGPDGKPVRDAAALRRIRALAIPPAWTDVWICADARGHIQATGRDARGRKQYRYHPRWRAVRDETKYHKMLAFAQKLPEIRRRVAEDMARPGLAREKVLATIVKLLETSLIRVGNDEYARANRSFGLTTLRDRHVEVDGAKIAFSFRGKGGKVHEIALKDRRLAKIVKACQDIPGQELFQYYDESGERRDVGSADVNEYLREIAGDEFTAKDFRTWAGTVLAAYALQEFEAFDSEAKAKRNVRAAIEAVAGQLGNTPAVCRKCYVHPEVLDGYVDGSLLEALKQQVEDNLAEELAGLTPEEAAVMAFLQKRLASEVSKRRASAAA